MQKYTICVGAFSILTIKPTLWHLPKIKLMQKLTLVVLLAKPSQPMLANNCLLKLDVLLVAVFSKTSVFLIVCAVCFLFLSKTEHVFNVVFKIKSNTLIVHGMLPNSNYSIIYEERL